MYLIQIPGYVYKITILETDEYYFGYRSFNRSLGLMPEDDFLKEYFSSNKRILNLIRNSGVSSITGEILYIDFDVEEVYWKEQELIETHFEDPLLINQYYNKRESGHRMFIPTDESKKRMIETRRRRRESGLHPEWLKKQQEGHSKRYRVTPPGGVSYEIVNLKAHCEKYNLNHSAMSQVGQGKKPHHKRWKCERLG